MLKSSHPQASSDWSHFTSINTTTLEKCIIYQTEKSSSFFFFFIFKSKLCIFMGEKSQKQFFPFWFKIWCLISTLGSRIIRIRAAYNPLKIEALLIKLFFIPRARTRNFCRIKKILSIAQQSLVIHEGKKLSEYL